MTTPMRSGHEGRIAAGAEPAALTVSTGTGRQPGEPAWRGVPVAEAIEDYRLACLSQAVDERQLTIHKQGAAYFHVSGAGHEALLIGLARSLRAGYDWFFPYYRDLALVLALGVTPHDVLLQCVGAAADPASGGRQMPSHWGSAALHIVTQSSATGSQCLPAVGCAEAGRYIATHGLPGIEAHADEVTFVSLGEGATSEGEFWESLNTACRLRLPVVYVVEDNGFAISVPAADQAPAPISTLVAGFPGLAVVELDGCDYFAVRTAGPRRSSGRASGPGPSSSTPTSCGCTRTRRRTTRRSTATPPPSPRTAPTTPCGAWATSSSTPASSTRAGRRPSATTRTPPPPRRAGTRCTPPSPTRPPRWRTSGTCRSCRIPPRRSATASSSRSARRSAARCTR